MGLDHCQMEVESEHTRRRGLTRGFHGESPLRRRLPQQLGVGPASWAACAFPKVEAGRIGPNECVAYDEADWGGGHMP